MSRSASTLSETDFDDSQESASSVTSYSCGSSPSLSDQRERYFNLGEDENDNERCRVLIDSPGLVDAILPDHVVGFDVDNGVEKIAANSIPFFDMHLHRSEESPSAKDPHGFESFVKDMEAIIAPLLSEQAQVRSRRWITHSGDKHYGYDLISLPTEETAILNGPVHAIIRIASELSQAELQVSLCAKDIFTCQRNRRFVLGIAVAGGKLTVLHGDRAGMVISEVYDIKERVDVLLRVCMGLLFVDLTRLGYDPAFTRENEKTFVRIAGDRYEFKRGIIKEHDLEGSGLRISLLEKGGKQYVMKDVWIERARESKEFDMFREISEFDIEGTARFVSHDAVSVNGEVDSTELAKQAWLEKYSLNCSSQSKVIKDHHRIVMTPFGEPLQKFRSLEELVSALKDVVLTIQALDKHKVLHRDISTENIILVDEGGMLRRGKLIDFEFATYYDVAAAPRLVGRAVGSVPFMSYRVLDYMSPKYYDELESVLYVLCWMCTVHEGPNDRMRRFTREERLACNGAIGANMRRGDDDYEEIGLRKHKLVRSQKAFQDVLKDFHPFFNPLKSLADGIRGALMDTQLDGELDELDFIAAPPEDVFANVLKELDGSLDKLRRAIPKTQPSIRSVLSPISGHRNTMPPSKERVDYRVSMKATAKGPTDEDKENDVPSIHINIAPSALTST